MNIGKGFLVALSIFLHTSSVHAELATDSPAIVTGSIVSASSSEVLLRLEDGRTEKRFPKNLFPKGTDFFPGRIVSIALPSSAPTARGTGDSQWTNQQIIRVIRLFQTASRGEKNKTSSVSDEVMNSILHSIGIQNAWAKKPNCLPVDAFGGLLKPTQTEKENDCAFDETLACNSASEITRLSSRNNARKSNMKQCNPLVFGPGLCAEIWSDQSAVCSEEFVSKCSKENYDDCVKLKVLPYVKSHPSEFRDLVSRYKQVCGDGDSSKGWMEKSSSLSFFCDRNELKAMLTNEKAMNDRATGKGTAGDCKLAQDDINQDLTKNKGVLFTTVESPASCGGKKLCVRQIKCMGSSNAVATTRFARCQAENCNSAKACLEDKMVAGSQSLGSLPRSVSGAGASSADH